MSIRPLSAALQKKAEDELNETPERVKVDLQILRDWLSQQPHLHSVKPRWRVDCFYATMRKRCTSLVRGVWASPNSILKAFSNRFDCDQWLVAFLRGCKYDIVKAKGKIDMYYTLKSTVPEFYENRDPLNPGIQELLKLGVLLPLRKCVREDSPRILLSRLGQFSHTSRPLSDLIKVSLMILEILLLEDDNLTIAGEDVIVETADLAFSMLWHWTPSLAKKVTSCSEKALSVRLKSMHLLNAPFFVGPAIKLFKMFLGAKMKDRIHSHAKDCSTLHDYIDKSVLPEEYGGTDSTLQELIDHWKAKVESHRDWFLEQSYSDESKRSKRTKTQQYLEID